MIEICRAIGVVLRDTSEIRRRFIPLVRIKMAATSPGTARRRGRQH